MPFEAMSDASSEFRALSRRTPATQEEMEREFGIARAAWQLEDAVAGCVRDEYPMDMRVMIQAREEHLRMTRWEVYSNRALLGMVALSVFELPPWCAAQGVQAVGLFVSGEEACFFNGEVMLSGVLFLRPMFGLAIEVVLLAVIGRTLMLKLHEETTYFQPSREAKHGHRGMSGRQLCQIGVAMIALELIDCVFYAVFRPSFRLAFIARTGLLCLLPTILELFTCVCACLKEFLSVAVFLVGVMVFYAWIFVTILKGADEDFEQFETFGAAFNSVFVAGVSDDFVDVLKKSYKTYRSLGVLWLSFLAIVHVLMLSLVLDTLTSAYMTFTEENMPEVAEKKIEGMEKAFHTLAKATGDPAGKEVDEAAFREFITEYSRSHRVAVITQKVAKAAFKAADKDHSGHVGEEEFCSFFCKMMQYKLRTCRKYSYFKDWYPELWESKWENTGFRHFVEGSEDEAGATKSKFDEYMDYVLILNFLLMVLEASFDMTHQPEPPWCDYMELVFSAIYLLQVILKLAVFSWAQYTADPSNVFDFFTTVVLLATSFLQQFFGRQLARYANMLRLFRLLRIIRNLKKLPSVQFMAGVISQLVVSSRDMMLLLGVMIFFFTMLSVQLFGGLLRKGDERLEESEYLEKGFEVLNCNDFFSAFGVWVVMLLQEYQPMFPDATSKVETIPGSWMVFPLFYVVGVGITFELVKAFTIEVFIALKEDAQRKLDAKKGEQSEHSGGHHGNHDGHDPAQQIDQLFHSIQDDLRSQGESLHSYLVGSMEAFHESIEVLEHRHGGGHGGHGHSGHGGEHGGSHGEHKGHGEH